MKKCSKCAQEKPYTEFHKHSQTRDGYKSRCKMCNRKEAIDYRNLNLDKAREKDKERLVGERKRLSLERVKTWSVNKKYLTTEKAKLAQAKRIRKWKKENSGKVNADTARRRASKLKATPQWADKSIIKNIYIQASILGLTVDHIVPLQGEIVCGLHCEDNMQLLSLSENSSKCNFWDGA